MSPGTESKRSSSEGAAREPALQLYDPRNGDLSLKFESLTGDANLSVPQRTNYFTIFWIQDGSGTFCAEAGEYPFTTGSLLFLTPYQSYKFISAESVRGLVLKFHANFLCIETYHHEVGCNGVLFNDTYGSPCVQLEECHERELAPLLDEMRRELLEGGLAQAEVLLSLLKIFLVRATRVKLQQQDVTKSNQLRTPEMLQDLKRLIEEHYRTHHAPADYAAMLNISPKALARLVKVHLNKTLTELIRDRIMRQAKWEMLHTRKPVKEVATALGFDDIFYFSRLFKRATGCSPTFFRDFETTIREGRNLSME